MLAMAEQIEKEAGLGGDLPLLGGTRRGECNTHSIPPKPKTTQCPKRKNHFFTWNNYTEEQIGGLLEFFNANATKYAFQEEIAPTTGTPHLQGMVMFERERRSTEWDKEGKGHYEALNKKDGEYQLKEKSRKPNGRQWTKGFPKPLKLITPDYWWQEKILKIIDTEADDRTVHWYWSKKGGIGKSQFCKYLIVKKNAIFISKGSNADIMYVLMNSNIDTSPAVVINLPKSQGNNVCYDAIESIKDGIIFSPKYESGYKVFNSPHIFVFANEPPKQNKMFMERFIVTELTDGTPDIESDEEE